MNKTITAAWKDVPDAPGLYLKSYQGTIQGWQELVLTSRGLATIDTKGHTHVLGTVGLTREWHRWFGPVPDDVRVE